MERILTLRDLPDDALRIVGEHLAHVEREADDIARDAASCAMVGNSALTTVSRAAWVRCGQVVEAGPDIRAHHESWGCQRPRAQLPKRDLVDIAMATSPGVRKNSSASLVRDILARNAPLAESCPIPRAAAVFIREAALARVPLAPKPSVFRDRDLSSCHVAVTNNAPTVRLRDARRAPALDPGERVSTRLQTLRARDVEFRDAGFVRRWKEDDLPKRLRIEDARRWCEENEVVGALAHGVLEMARANCEWDRASVSRVARAFGRAKCDSPFIHRWSGGSERYALYRLHVDLQIRIVGFQPFAVSPSDLASLEVDDVDAYIDALNTHARRRNALFLKVNGLTHRICTMFIEGLSNADTLSDADQVLDAYEKIVARAHRETTAIPGTP